MEEDWKQFEEWVSEHGGRHTIERRKLFEAVAEMPVLFSTNDMAQYVARQTEEGGLMLSRPTIYNTLEAFVQSGLLERIHAKSGNIYVRTRCQEAMVLQECTSCGAVQNIKPGGVALAVRHLAFRRFTPRNSITLVHGLCTQCESARKKRTQKRKQ